MPEEHEHTDPDEPQVDPDSAFAKLIPSRQAFVNEYFKNNFCAAEAYARSVSRIPEPDKKKDPEAWKRWRQSIRSNSAYLLHVDEVWAAVEERLKQEAMQASEVLWRLGQQGRNIASRYMQTDGTVNLEALLADGHGHLIKGMKWGRSGNLMVEFYDAQAAQKLIGQHFGLFGATGSEGDPINVKMNVERDELKDLPPDQLLDLYKSMLRSDPDD